MVAFIGWLGNTLLSIDRSGTDGFKANTNISQQRPNEFERASKRGKISFTGLTLTLQNIFNFPLFLLHKQD